MTLWCVLFLSLLVPFLLLVQRGSEEAEEPSHSNCKFMDFCLRAPRGSRGSRPVEGELLLPLLLPLPFPFLWLLLLLLPLRILFTCPKLFQVMVLLLFLLLLITRKPCAITRWCLLCCFVAFVCVFVCVSLLQLLRNSATYAPVF